MPALRRSKTWVVLSLFAMLGVVLTPALAFHCCCTSIPTSPPGHRAQTDAQPAVVVGDQPACHGAVVQPVVREDAKPSRSTQSAPARHDQSSNSYKTWLASIDQSCECPQVEAPVTTLTDTTSVVPSYNASVALPAAHCIIAIPDTKCIRDMADGAFEPRGPSLSPHSGRAPPVI